jgi:hypothetical protein
MRQDLSRQKGVMRAEMSGECLPQGRELGAHTTPGELGQDVGIARSLHSRDGENGKELVSG